MAMSKSKGTTAKKPVQEQAAAPKKGVERLIEIASGRFKGTCVQAAWAIDEAFKADEKACLRFCHSIGRDGVSQAFWADAGSTTLTSLNKTALLPYRQALIREMKLESTAELMLLDLLLMSYADAYMFEAFTASATKDPETGHGSIKGKADFVRVVSGIARAYTSQFASLMQTLVNLEKPPIQVKIERAGTVAVQVNEAGSSPPEKPKVAQLPDSRDAVERVPAFTATERREPVEIAAQKKQ
jgi:hypothetical protein